MNVDEYAQRAIELAGELQGHLERAANARREYEALWRDLEKEDQRFLREWLGSLNTEIPGLRERHAAVLSEPAFAGSFPDMVTAMSRRFEQLGNARKHPRRVGRQRL